MASDRKDYLSPDCEIIAVQEHYLICISDPDNGGIENIDYEDWTK